MEKRKELETNNKVNKINIYCVCMYTYLPMYNKEVYVFVCVCVQARNQTFLEGGSKFGMVAQMKWAL